MAENMVLKEKMDCMKERDNTYADMVKGQSPTHRSPVLTKQIHKHNNPSDVNVLQDQPLQEQNEKNDDDATINNTTDIGTERNLDDKPTATWRGRGNQRGRVFVRGHGRGGRGRDHTGERDRGVSNHGYNRGYNRARGRENNNKHGNYSHDLRRSLEQAISSLWPVSLLMTLHQLAAATSGLMTITTTSNVPTTKYRRNADRSDFDARSSLETVSLVMVGSVVLLTPAVPSSYIVCILIHVITISGNGFNVKEEKCRIPSSLS